MASQSPPIVVYPNSDIILLTQDGVQLHLHKAALRQFSQVFDAMLSMPETPGVATPAPVPIQETASTFMHLVSHMYHSDPQMTTGQFNSLEEAIAALEVARKYEYPALEATMLSTVEDMLDAESNPIRKWAIASQYRFPAARDAAMLAYYESDVDYRETLGAIRELDHVTGKQLTDLLDTRMRVQSAAYTMTLEYVFDELGCEECQGITQAVAMYIPPEEENPPLKPSDIWRKSVKMEDIFSEWATQAGFLESCVAQADCGECQKTRYPQIRLPHLRDHLYSRIPQLAALRPDEPAEEYFTW